MCWVFENSRIIFLRLNWLGRAKIFQLSDVYVSKRNILKRNSPIQTKTNHIWILFYSFYKIMQCIMHVALYLFEYRIDNRAFKPKKSNNIRNDCPFAISYNVHCTLYIDVYFFRKRICYIFRFHVSSSEIDIVFSEWFQI